MPGRQYIYCLLGLLVTAVGIHLTGKYISGYAEIFGAYHDDAIYAVTAKAIAEGSGYRIISLPNEALQTKYPPLFPLLLSIGFMINPRFPDNVTLLEAISAISGVAFIVIAGAFLRASKRTTALISLLVVAITWANQQLLSFLPVTMADLPFAALCVATIWLIESNLASFRLKEPITVRWLIAGLLLSLCVLTHMIGTILVAACLLQLGILRRWRAILIVSATSFALLCPYFSWVLNNAARTPAVMVYYTNYFQAFAHAGKQTNGFLNFAIANLQSGFTELIEVVVQLFKASPATELTFWNLLPYAIVWLILLSGISRDLFSHYPRRRVLASWLLLHSLASLMLDRGSGMRRLLVTLPFVYFYLLIGLRQLRFYLKPVMLKYTSVSAQQFGSIASLVVLSLACIALVGNFYQDMLWAGQYAPRAPRAELSTIKRLTEPEEFRSAYLWIKRRTNDDSVIVWNNDPTCYLHTGRKAIMAFPGQNLWTVSPELLHETITYSNAEYLIADPVTTGGITAYDELDKAIQQLNQQHPGYLTPVFQSDSGLITILAVNQSVNR